MRALARSRAVTSAATLNRRELVGLGIGTGVRILVVARVFCRDPGGAELRRSAGTPSAGSGKIDRGANCHPIGIRGHGDAILYTVGFAVENLIAADEPRRHEGEQIAPERSYGRGCGRELGLAPRQSVRLLVHHGMAIRRCTRLSEPAHFGLVDAPPV